MKLGLALGGGGAKGLAHVGVLKVLQRNGIDCDVVAGTSIGALVGALYAAGKLQEFEEEVCSVRLTEIASILSPSWSFGGLFSGRNVLERLDDVLGTDSFQDLRKPFAAISADLSAAEIVVLKDGSLKKAIRASISIPGIFTPVTYGDRLYVDGGVLEPVPVEAVRDLGADKVLAIDLFSNRTMVDEKRSAFPLWPRGISNAMNHLKALSPLKRNREDAPLASESVSTPHMIELLERSFAVSQIGITRMRLKENPPEILLTPPVADVGVLDFHRAQAIISRGEQYAEQALSSIIKSIES